MAAQQVFQTPTCCIFEEINVFDKYRKNIDWTIGKFSRMFIALKAFMDKY